MNDYKLWRLLYQFLPEKFCQTLFTIITLVQLYLLGARYVLKEIRRRLSSKVRKLSEHEPDIPDHLPNKIAIVTGGSRGIGLSVARDLYRRGCTVIVTSSAATENERENIADEVRQYQPLLDRNRPDGFEHHYQINYLSHVLLTWLLMPALNRRSSTDPPARVVNVSSSTHYPRNLFIDDLQSQKTPYSPYHAYAQSKLCQIMFTYYLSDWLKQSGDFPNILVNSLHPGVAMTGLYQNVWWVKLFPQLAEFLFRSADEGAETVIYVALSTEIESSGYYYEDCARLKSSRFSLNKKIQSKLGDLTRKQLSRFVDLFNEKYPQYSVPRICKSESILEHSERSKQ
ncbi:Dehydrogenase/reductase SDR family member on chromosome X [Sarcoptes scabiei]|nr:Dehydrogenase/reductase SDR family member on chromosome X [Sarcoptes scabiei]